MIFISQIFYFRSFEFVSKHWCGRSFPWVETRHLHVSFSKVKSCSALSIAFYFWRADFNWHSNVMSL